MGLFGLWVIVISGASVGGISRSSEYLGESKVPDLRVRGSADLLQYIYPYIWNFGNPRVDQFIDTHIHIHKYTHTHIHTYTHTHIPDIMSFGFSLSDIVVSYRLAQDIYYRCFTKAQGAGAFTTSKNTYTIPSSWRDDSACSFTWPSSALLISSPRFQLLTDF